MEIDFNTSRLTKANAAEAVSLRRSASSAGESTAFSSTYALEQKLKDLPTVRPEKVAQARALIASVQYPPEELVDRIANLLAIHAND